MVFQHKDIDRDAEVSPSLGYTRTAIALHWIVAGLILFLTAHGWYLDGVPRGTPERTIVVNLHKSIGITAGLIIIALLWWRARHSAPPFPHAMPQWEVRLARSAHVALYGCMVMMPLSGYLGSNFSKYGVKYFGLVALPPWGVDDKAIYALLNGTHVVTSYVFVALIAVHVVAVLKHELIDRDAILRRMWPSRRDA